MPPACVQTRAPRCVEGHNGASKVANGKGMSPVTSVLIILTGPTTRMGMVAVCSLFCQRIFFLKSIGKEAIKSNHFTGKSLMTAIEYVILVDEQDKEIGVTEKLTAHQKNLLHRAFSVF